MGSVVKPPQSKRSAAEADKAPAASQGRSRGAIFRLLVVFGTVVVTLVIVDLLLPLFLPISDTPLSFWDPTIGPRRTPCQSGMYVRGREINAPYHFNAQGWNHPEDYVIEKPEGTVRVCVVGDSYVEALQVPCGQSLAAVAQEQMSCPDRPAQWYPFGVSGFGAAHAYLVIKHYVLDYAPEVVIILFVDNDVRDCSPYLARQEDYTAWFKFDQEGELVLHPPAVWRPSLAKRMLVRSALFRYLYLQLGLLRRHGQPAVSIREGMLGAGVDPEIAGGLTLRQRQEKSWALIEALFARCREDCAQRGAIFALAYFGSPPRILAAGTGETYTPPPKEIDPYCQGERRHEMGREILGPMMQRLGVPYLDLTNALIEEVTATGQRYNFADDTHYGPVGHQGAGKALAAWVEALLEHRP